MSPQETKATEKTGDMFAALSGALLKPALTRLSRGRLPQATGRIYLPGLSEPVTVSRDDHGIPRIQAKHRSDLFLAQGFIHAQDRLWQIEMHRRAATGRLAAMVGEIGLDTDRLSRTLGFARLAQATWDLSSDKVRADVEAYTAGINAFLNSGAPLPLEFSLLRHRPEPWTALDSVAFGRMMAWILSHGFASKLTRAQLIERVGPAAAAELELFYPEDNPVTLPNGIEFNLLEVDGKLRAADGPFIRRSMEGSARGSNAWVIAGQRTTTGHPILCNDMHLPIGSPSLWYVLHLNCPGEDEINDLRVSGASLPGVPYVLVGHNPYIAWGATLSFVDIEDLFVERFAGESADQYEFQGQWRQAHIVEEIIEVRNGKSHSERVIITHHGPLISNVLPVNGQALALASLSLQSNRSFDGFAMLNEARGWDDFVSAVQNIHSPSLNLVYADVEGNIGYYVTGRAPIRNSGTGQVPVPGWTGEHEWIGHVPFEAMPHALNPSQGYLVTANNKIVDDDYPYYLGISWRNGYRARRISDLIQQQHLLSPEDSQRLQHDILSVPGRELVDRLRGLSPEDEDAALCLQLLRDWDGNMEADSAGALVYKALMNQLTMAILRPRLGRSLTEGYLGTGPHPTLYPFGETHSQWIAVLLRLLAAEETEWLPADPERERLLERCLAKTTVELRSELGPDPQTWSWGRRHQILFGHTLARQQPLDRVFNLGPYTVGGDADTICQMSISPEDGANNIAPSYRQIMTPGQWERSMAMHAPGQSGHLASRHYADLVEFWLNGEYYELPWLSQDVVQTDGNALRLFPPLATGRTGGE